jgi:hypothetical protein
MLGIMLSNSGSENIRPLEPCPGHHDGRHCHASCLACHEGPIDEVPDYPQGLNPSLARFELLRGSERLLALIPDSTAPNLGWDGSSLALYVNTALFTDMTDGPLPVWAVVVKERSQESLHVTLHATREEGEAAYRQKVAEFVTYRDCGMDHGLAEPCECDTVGVTDEQLALRELIPRTDTRCCAVTRTGAARAGPHYAVPLETLGLLPSASTSTAWSPARSRSADSNPRLFQPWKGCRGVGSAASARLSPLPMRRSKPPDHRPPSFWRAHTSVSS